MAIDIPGSIPFAALEEREVSLGYTKFKCKSKGQPHNFFPAYTLSVAAYFVCSFLCHKVMLEKGFKSILV